MITIYKWIRLQFGNGSSSRFIRVIDQEATDKANEA